MTANFKRIGILTGGGDCPGLNAVIRAVAKSAMDKYDATVIGIEDGFEGFVEGRMHEIRNEHVSGILRNDGDAGKPDRRSVRAAGIARRSEVSACFISKGAMGHGDSPRCHEPVLASETRPVPRTCRFVEPELGTAQGGQA